MSDPREVTMQVRCICDYGPGTGGSVEDCPAHGRSTDWLWEQADRLRAERDAAVAREAALRASIEALLDEAARVHNREHERVAFEHHDPAVRDYARRIHDALRALTGEGPTGAGTEPDTEPRCPGEFALDCPRVARGLFCTTHSANDPNVTGAAPRGAAGTEEDR